MQVGEFNRSLADVPASARVMIENPDGTKAGDYLRTIFGDDGVTLVVADDWEETSHITLAFSIEEMYKDLAPDGGMFVVVNGSQDDAVFPVASTRVDTVDDAERFVIATGA